jgi:hypothetical protein
LDEKGHFIDVSKRASTWSLVNDRHIEFGIILLPTPSRNIVGQQHPFPVVHEGNGVWILVTKELLVCFGIVFLGISKE